jgi:hypothetical protein
MVTTETFYEAIPVFSEFDGILDETNFQCAPGDWWVVITDVIDSTKAIEAGRYKDVNIIGAAAIAAIQNVMDGVAFPFVFGGDGATALIPNHKKAAVEAELNALRRLSENNFELGLRVGMVSVKELEQENLPVQVGRYQLESLYPLAIFRGGAVTRAEKKIKGNVEKYGVPRQEAKETDLTKLSCRWQPMAAHNGKIIALIVSAQTEDSNDTYTAFIGRLSEILKGQFDAANPVKTQLMKYRPLWKMWRSDVRYQTKLLLLLPRLIDTLAASLLFGGRLFRLIGFLRNYVDATPSHCDFRKFDDMLRMVLDCSLDQIDAIQSLCDEFYARGEIFYGIHCSDEALMTCYVPSMKDGGHIHFIDGGDGGYAIAAKQMKLQRNLQRP